MERVGIQYESGVGVWREMNRVLERWIIVGRNWINYCLVATSEDVRGFADRGFDIRFLYW